MVPASERSWLKRGVDFVAAWMGLVAAAPLLAVVSGLILLSMGTPILFAQRRPGRLGRPFVIYKFRTMNGKRDGNNRLLPDSERLTRLGKVLRASSLDELPELINVIKGDMSLVGPRPLLMQYLERYTPDQRRRHEVKPGVTGWAQVNGRNALAWEEKFRLDLWYVDNWSLALDIRILLLTLRQVLRRDGISHPGEATMAEFRPADHRKGSCC